jgi:hypothetical protein
MNVLDAIAALDRSGPGCGLGGVPGALPVIDILAALDAIDDEVGVVGPAKPAANHVTRPLSLREFVARVAQAEPERAEWPESWLATTDSCDGLRCKTMWQSVLRFGLCDACDEAAKAFRMKWNRPVSWVGSADFHEVCALAGFDSEAVRDRAMMALATPVGAAKMRAWLTQAGWDR